MAGAGYIATTGGAVGLTTATAKSVLSLLAPATFGLDLVRVRVGIDAATTLVVELCRWDGAGAGTATSVTPQQAYGRAIAHGVTAARAYTVEPTALTVLEEWAFTSGATAVYDVPLGTSYDCDPTDGFVLRLTAGATANARAAMGFERC